MRRWRHPILDDTLARCASVGVSTAGRVLLVQAARGPVAIGGLLFVTVDEDGEDRGPNWLCVVVLGPLSYLVPRTASVRAGVSLLHVRGSRGLVRDQLHAFLRCSAFFGLHYFWLVMAAAWCFVAQGRGIWTKPTVWRVQLVAAVATARWARSTQVVNNVYIPLGCGSSSTGVWGLWMIDRATEGSRRRVRTRGNASSLVPLRRTIPARR